VIEVTDGVLKGGDVAVDVHLARKSLAAECMCDVE
jgi:hypothetical protein